MSFYAHETIRWCANPAYHDSFRPLPPFMLQNLEPQIRPLHLIPRELGFQMGCCLSVDRASPTSSPCSIALKSHELICALKTDFTFHSMTHLRTRSLSKLPHLYTQVWIWGGVGVGWGGGANNNIHVSRHIAVVHTHRALGWGWVAKRRLQWIQWKGMHYRQVQKI